MTAHHRISAPIAIVAALSALLALLALVSIAAPVQAGAQACDPAYGCQPVTTTTVPPAPICTTSTAAAQVGARVSVTVQHVPVGIQVQLRFAGQVVATGTARASSAQVSAAATPAFTSMDFVFNVPNLATGRYTLEATGPNFICRCLTAEGGFSVLAADAARIGDATTLGRRPGNLARTGLAIGALLLVAVGLIAIGRTVMAGSRRRGAA